MYHQHSKIGAMIKKLSVKFQADWNILKVRCNGKYESEILFFYLRSYLLISRIYAVGSKFLNLGEALSREIIVCISGSDIDRRRNVWDNLFRKFSVVKSGQ